MLACGGLLKQKSINTVDKSRSAGEKAFCNRVDVFGDAWWNSTCLDNSIKSQEDTTERVM